MARRTKVIDTDAPTPDTPPSYNPATEIVTDLAESTSLPATATEFDTAKLDAQPAAERSRTPDPHPYAQINLGDGQNMRLWWNKRKAEMAVTFSDKPEPQHTQVLKDAGFRWKGEDKAWVLPMDRDQKWKAVVDAERAFKEVGSAIRESKGLNVEQGVA